MAVWQAKQCCPDLVVLPPDMGEYIRFSKMAREIYEDYTDQIEPFGLDESWLDVTGSVGLYGSPMTIAKEIRKRVKFELGITLSIGVADRYTCRIQGKESYLWFEKGRWFVAAKR